VGIKIIFKKMSIEYKSHEKNDNTERKQKTKIRKTGELQQY
jgi:hypothetical protein